MNNTNTYEVVSALADGQLADDEWVQAMDIVTGDPDALEAWRTYHLVGEVLRYSDVAPGTATPQFVQRLSQRLASEPVPARDGAAGGDTALPAQETPRVLAANDPAYRWKLVAGCASLAAAAAVGWNLLAGSSMLPRGPQLAATPLAGQAVMIRDAQLDELLAAHQQLGGASALQLPASFIRQVTFDEPGR